MNSQAYLQSTHSVLASTPAYTRTPWTSKRQRLPGGVPHRFIGQPVTGPQCCTVTIQIRDEDLKNVLALADRLAMRAGSQFARVYRDRRVVRIEYTLPPDQWRNVHLGRLPHHRDLATIGQKALGPVARISWGISPHKAIFGGSQTGKTTCLADIIISLVKVHEPSSLKFLILNPKNALELNRFCRLPHLATGIATDYEDCSNLLRFGIAEMELRKTDASRTKSRLVIIIDEVAELVQVDEAAGLMITRLSQMAGGLNINVIAASQAPNPSVFGKKGFLAQANFGARLIFQLPQPYAYLASGGVPGLRTEALGAVDKKGDGLAVSGGVVTRFRAALPDEEDFNSLPRREGKPEPLPDDHLAGDTIATEMCWQLEDLADRLAFAAEVKNSATAIREQFGGSVARAGWVRDLHSKFFERQQYWRWAGK